MQSENNENYFTVTINDINNLKEQLKNNVNYNKDDESRFETIDKCMDEINRLSNEIYNQSQWTASELIQNENQFFEKMKLLASCINNLKRKFKNDLPDLDSKLHILSENISQLKSSYISNQARYESIISQHCEQIHDECLSSYNKAKTAFDNAQQQISQAENSKNNPAEVKKLIELAMQEIEIIKHESKNVDTMIKNGKKLFETCDRMGYFEAKDILKKSSKEMITTNQKLNVNDDSIMVETSELIARANECIQPINQAEREQVKKQDKNRMGLFGAGSKKEGAKEAGDSKVLLPVNHKQ